MGPSRHRERKLPVQQLSILAICRFAEPLASTSLYPYLPEMVESFGIPQNEVGKWAGICAAIFSLFQACFGIPWGRFSDKYGRRPAILLGLTSTMLTSLMWGFSKNLPMAIVARALAGAGNGNVGIIRTTVAEMVPFKELQPLAFSIMPLVWNVGSIFGPTIGGALANPLNVKPDERREHPSLLEMFPYALPNIVSACFFAIGITTGFLYLEETLETAQGRKDYGLMLGQKLKKIIKGHSLKGEVHTNGETSDPLLKRTNTSTEDEEDGLAYETKPKFTAPSWREVLNKQAIINLAAYTGLAMHSMAFDQLIPVYMQYRPIGTPGATPFNPPLKFAGGFGLNHFQIGLMSTGYGIVGMLIQFFLFPPLARKLGVLFCLKVVATCFPFIYFITPFTALLPTTRWQVGCMFAVMFLKCLCGIFAFPCSTILLTNSASSLRTLGTLNGISTSVSAIGRAAGPAMAGAIFTAGVKKGYIIAPWWFLTAVAVIALVPVFWLVEGEGFGGDDEVSISDEDSIEEEQAEDQLQATAIEGEAEAMGEPGPLLPQSTLKAEEHEEHAYGGLAPLSRTNTGASSNVFSDEGLDPPSRTPSRLEGADSQDGRQTPILSRSNSRRGMRRLSIPIGMGGQGISRRYSSNLGQSLGSMGNAGDHH